MHTSRGTGGEGLGGQAGGGGGECILIPNVPVATIFAPTASMSSRKMFPPAEVKSPSKRYAYTLLKKRPLSGGGKITQYKEKPQRIYRHTYIHILRRNAHIP